MPILEAKNLKKYYPVKKTLFSRPDYVRAVDDVSFVIEANETLGLVGESGCGKSTLGRLLVQLETPDGGDIVFESMHKSDRQMIFQDPMNSLNPAKRIYNMLDEILYLHYPMDKDERYAKIIELMEMVGLDKAHLSRYPHQFSGGQRQRIVIARALSVDPRIIVADEPVSSLDVSVQAQIINLFSDIQQRTGISFLFISHDLAVVENISDRLMVMYLGRIVESGSTGEIISNPGHPYTTLLLKAVPGRGGSGMSMMAGDLPSPLHVPSGCRFHPRCPKASEICRKQEPVLGVSGNEGHYVACHFKRSGKVAK